MIKNHLTIALRNLWRNKFHAFINVVGLSIGISACLVIFLMVRHELSFDTFRENYDHTYRIYSQFSGSFEATNTGVVAPLAEYIDGRFSDVKKVIPLHTIYEKVQVMGSDGLPAKELDYQDDLVIVPPDFFEVFPEFEWISGSPITSLSAPHQVVLTTEKANTYFGNDDPNAIIGRQIIYRDSLILTVSGIIASETRQTDLGFGDFVSFSTIKQSWLSNQIRLEDWSSTNSSSQLLIQTTPETDVPTLQKEISDLGQERYLQDNGDATWQCRFILQPFNDIHFNTELATIDDLHPPTHLPTLRALILVAILLLVIAAINYINLETAQAMRRSKEVGVRKVLGSTRRGLVFQFLGETLVVTLISVLISLQLASLGIGYFDEFIPAEVTLQFTDPWVFGFLALFTIFVTILAGFYPSFVLSSFQPVRALKDQVISLREGLRNTNLRRALIVFQFIFSIGLIFGTFVIGRQIDYMLQKDMGFDESAVIYFFTPWRAPAEKRSVLEQQLKQLPELVEMSRSSQPPAHYSIRSNVIKYDNGKDIQANNVYLKTGDTNYIHFYNLELLAGRNITPSDSIKEMVINETYLKLLGFDNAQDAIGQHLIYNDDQLLPIVGVVKDFHLQSMRNAIPPTMIANESAEFNCFNLRLHNSDQSGENLKKTLDKIGQIWAEIYPEEAFEHQFLDETVASFYKSEQRTAKLMRSATLVAILISCLGLLGLISFMATQRTKEIGIRKVLGASVLQIVFLLSKEFIKLVLIASLIGFPLAWWGMNRWLSDFVYHIEIQWWMFLTVGGITLVLAMLTLSFRATQAALANPVKSLRSE